MFTTVREGDMGKGVLYMQRRLNGHGEVKLLEDGIFGYRTRMVLMEFQCRWNLEVDGICGEKTWECLLRREKTLMLDRGVKDEEWERIEKEELEGVEGILVKFLKICWGDLNKQESPMGSNKGGDIVHLVQGTRITGVKKMVKSEYKKHWGISAGVTRFPPWCAIAISGWLAELFQAKSWRDIPFGNWFGGVTQTVMWGEREGVYFEDVENMESGDLFVMGVRGSQSDEKGRGNNEYGHIGVVLYSDGDYIQTIEGNTANGVRTRRRKKESVKGYVRWVDVCNIKDGEYVV